MEIVQSYLKEAAIFMLYFALCVSIGALVATMTYNAFASTRSRMAEIIAFVGTMTFLALIGGFVIGVIKILARLYVGQ